MASSPTELYLPQTFPYPIKIVSIDAVATASIQRGTRLLGYSFVHLPPTPDAQPETRFGTWDSAIEGTVEKWNVKVGDVISRRKAKDKPVVVIIEPCKHGMQVGGLCVLCGKDMTNTDYTGFSDASRASIQMTHSAFGPTVSLEEAQRIERETAEDLLKARKLSLIVDLDQTIVHATVDPTVGEWIAEGESWEARQARKASSSKPSDESDDSSSDSDDECNPNWEALKDVKKFRLGPESFGLASHAQKGKGKHKLIENEGCMYYIKPRPGWKEFLEETAKKYEMHVYTMGTRAYAEEVCAAIDPDGKIFGGRLLSRDESGSLTQKSLQRLFPCDTSMVVIIDDRADVWEWSPNLIKVIPYDFFVGIGDINSTFLPKLEPLAPSIPPPSVPSSTPSKGSFLLAESEKIDTESQETSPDISPTPPATPLVIPEPPLAVPGDSEQAELATNVLLTRNSLALEAQLEERPLAKKQEALSEGEPPHEHHHHHHHHTPADEKPAVEKPAVEKPTVETPAAETPPASEAPTKEEKRSTTPEHEKVVRKALLKNDDFELERVGKLLDEVHNRFFNSFDLFSKRKPLGKREKPPYDVTQIIPRIRTEVLEGVHILFSSVIPLDTRPESTEIWRMAHMFGARCSTELKPDITHVVAAKRGTVKVDMARKRGGIKIVWLAWFTDSIALWRHQDETAYLLDEPPVVTTGAASSSPVTDSSQQISSDPEPDADDWDQEPMEVKNAASLELSAIDWNDINDEVDAFLNESDDEENGDARSAGSGMRSRNVSEDEGTDGGESVVSVGSVSNTPRTSRKRLRSVTPSDGGGSLNGSKKGDDVLRSPLAKRKKLAAERTGYSRLKDSISAEELVAEAAAASELKSTAVSAVLPQGEAMDEGEDDGDDEEEEEEDDFLARELEEEWG
ncbi:RNA polymerase II subunit A C-terminal domain phosphatase [Hypsizygus marmoreus]|uniref:RNA polymerase II subunit A C-terminal domain phosphatase n=1 Tax=Hypsizygus marmoreus TaxID=39966 RepID=A0A369K9I6_HYPMA|nr:RNA polymerase II subunit A C-terminal domain phosphatase [Hypsizygus marmoreus]